MKVYVASHRSNTEEVRQVQQALQEMGHTITYDWVPGVAVSQDELTEVELQERSCDDLDGVVTADLCIFLFTKDVIYRGALVELGVALATVGTDILVVGHYADECLFVHHPDVRRFETTNDLLKEFSW